jgi:dipeptidyl aminopeptidase/acylaminoacyl peptidase
MKLIGVTAAAVLACGAARAAPLEAYGKLPVMDMVSISPDGTKVAFVQPVDGKPAVVVDSLDPAAVVIEMPPSGQKVRALVWADPTHLLVVKSKAGFTIGIQSAAGEWYMVQSLDVQKRKATALFGQPQDLGQGTRMRGPDTLNTISAIPETRMVSGHPTVFAPGTVFVDSRGARALLSADLDSGKEQVVEHVLASEQGRSWILDGDGARIAQTTYDQTTHIWMLQLRRNGALAEAYSVHALNNLPRVLGVTGDGKSILLETTDDNGVVEVRPVSLADGTLGGPLSEYSSFASLIHDPATQRIIGGVKYGMEPTYAFFDPKDQAGWETVANSFPDEQVDPVSWSRDRSRVIVRVTGLRHGIVYAFVDLAAHKAKIIGPAYKGITADDLADVSIVRYPAQDGRSIQGFLTLPTGRAPKNLPLIVLPHGGPGDRDESGFDWWAQALASRGYAVLQPQFRGSSGFGWELEAAGFGEFGRKMQSDLSDGVRLLAAKGYVDPKRVCIVGASYGGYAALAGVTLEQGVYRCAVAVAGVSDLHKFIGGSLADADHSSAVRYWDRLVGAKDPSDPVFDKISPLKHAGQANVPVLLIHGHDDTVVPLEQSVNMEAALKQANKPVEFVMLSSEDHWLSRDATRQQMLQATAAFLEKNNPPQ